MADAVVAIIVGAVISAAGSVASSALAPKPETPPEPEAPPLGLAEERADVTSRKRRARLRAGGQPSTILAGSPLGQPGASRGATLTGGGGGGYPT